MTNEVSSNTTSPSDEMSDILGRVRQLDPTSEEAVVRGYIREMTEADALLNTVDLDDVPLVVCFSAAWAEGSVG